MQPGKYIIISVNSVRMLGAFEIVDGSLHNLMGFAQEVLEPGELTLAKEHKIRQLVNGYVKIVRIDDHEHQNLGEFLRAKKQMNREAQNGN